jgi:hypothetical protein
VEVVVVVVVEAELVNLLILLWLVSFDKLFFMSV